MGKHDKQKVPAVEPAPSAAEASPTATLKRVYVRATHNLPRAARASSGEVLWFSPTGSEHDVDADTVEILKSDPLLHVVDLDAPQATPANVEAVAMMPDLVSAVVAGEEVSALLASTDAETPAYPREPVLVQRDAKPETEIEQVHVAKGEDDRVTVSHVNPKDE